jgi:hypothetical protein
VRLLDYDIGAEEERTRCKDRRDAAYSILARTLVKPFCDHCITADVA